MHSLKKHMNTATIPIEKRAGIPEHEFNQAKGKEMSEKITDKKWRPNILYIMTDRFNERCISAYGHPDVKTPVIDSLIETGVSFRNTFCQNALCQPSRVSIFSGQYPHTHGVENNYVHGGPKSEMSPLPRLLRDTAGYRTGAVGKIHLGTWPSQTGFDRIESCCDTTIGEAGDDSGECAYYRYLREKGFYEEFRKTALESPQEVLNHMHYGDLDIPAEHSLEAWTVDQTIDFMDEPDEAPFFAWCSFLRPHNPHMPPPDAPVKYDPDSLTLPEDHALYVESKPGYQTRPGLETLWNSAAIGEKHLRNALAGYYGNISWIDHEIGRMLDHLRDTGKLENTIVIFSADHGCFAGNYGQIGVNGMTYDHLYRIPYIWNCPAHFPKSRFYDLVESIDLYPTLCDMLGLDIPPSVQGISHAHALYRTQFPEHFSGREDVFFERSTVKTIRTRTHKLSYCFNGESRSGELYDLVEDPDELRNRFDEPSMAHIQKDLMERLVNRMIATTQPSIVSNVSSEYISPKMRWHTARQAAQRKGAPTANEYWEEKNKQQQNEP